MKTKFEKNPAAAPQNSPVPLNRAVTPAMVKVRATRPISEQIDGVMYRFTTGDEFEIPAARVPGLGALIQVLALLLFCAVACAAPNGYETRSASGSTAATLHFPGSPNGTRLVTLDATSDKAASKVTWTPGATPLRVITAAASTATNFYVASSTAASNDVLLLQNSALAVTNKTVWTNTSQTNYSVTLGHPLSLAVAAGDTVRKLYSTTSYTTRTPAAADATAFYLNVTNGLVADGVVVVNSSTGLVTATIAAVISNVFKVQPITPRLPCDVAVADVIYKLATNYAVVGETIAYDATSIVVVASNGITAADRVYIESAAGRCVRVVDAASDGTHIVVTVAAGFPLAAGDRVWLLTASDYTVKLAGMAGDPTVTLDTVTGLAAGDKLVVASTADGVHRANAGSTASNTGIGTLTLTGAMGVAIPAGSTLYTLTNAHSVIFPAAIGENAITLNNATNLTAGDTLLISPVAGGHMQRAYIASAAATCNKITTTAVLGIALAAGDDVFTTGTASTVTVGNTSINRIGDAIFVAPPGRPVQVSLDGTSACSINTATAKY